MQYNVLDTWYAYGLQAAAYVKNNNIVVAYRGSEDLWKFDSYEFYADWIVSDGLGFLTGFNAEMPAAKTFIENIMNNYSNYNIYVTGHSLGGHLAYNAAAEGINYSESSIKGIVTFNGLGLTTGLALFGDLWDEEQLQKKLGVIRNYSVEGDPVSKGFLGFTTFHYGTTYTYAQSSKAPDAHSLYTFLEQLGPTSRYDYYQ